jgi:cbb3-type cytochrome oxidase subunit 1
MEKFVKNFIFMSIVYLVIASLLGVWMLARPGYPGGLRFVHSHLMLLGWVSMMIYGVGYHILPRFAGRLLKSRTAGVIQFWTANVGLIGMLVFYMLNYNYPDKGYGALSVLFGAIEVFSIGLFFYNMIVSVYGKESRV